MLMIVLAILVTNINYLFTLASGTYIEKLSPTSNFSYQYLQIVTNFKSPTSRCHQHHCHPILLNFQLTHSNSSYSQSVSNSISRYLKSHNSYSSVPLQLDHSFLQVSSVRWLSHSISQVVFVLFQLLSFRPRCFTSDLNQNGRHRNKAVNQIEIEALEGSTV